MKGELGSRAISKAIPSITKKKKRVRGKLSKVHKIVNFGGIISILE